MTSNFKNLNQTQATSTCVFKTQNLHSQVRPTQHTFTETIQDNNNKRKNSNVKGRRIARVASRFKNNNNNRINSLEIHDNDTETSQQKKISDMISKFEKLNQAQSTSTRVFETQTLDSAGQLSITAPSVRHNVEPTRHNFTETIQDNNNKRKNSNVKGRRIARVASRFKNNNNNRINPLEIHDNDTETSQKKKISDMISKFEKLNQAQSTNTRVFETQTLDCAGQLNIAAPSVTHNVDPTRHTFAETIQDNNNSTVKERRIARVASSFKNNNNNATETNQQRHFSDMASNFKRLNQAPGTSTYVLETHNLDSSGQQDFAASSVTHNVIPTRHNFAETIQGKSQKKFKINQINKKPQKQRFVDLKDSHKGIIEFYNRKSKFGIATYTDKEGNNRTVKITGKNLVIGEDQKFPFAIIGQKILFSTDADKKIAYLVKSEDGRPLSQDEMFMKLTHSDYHTRDKAWAELRTIEKKAKSERENKINSSSMTPINENTISDEVCIICYDSFAEEIAVLSTCNHEFCLSCICKWKVENNSCPLCRGNIQSIQCYLKSDKNKIKINFEEEELENEESEVDEHEVDEYEVDEYEVDEYEVDEYEVDEYEVDEYEVDEYEVDEYEEDEYEEDEYEEDGYEEDGYGGFGFDSDEYDDEDYDDTDPYIDPTMQMASDHDSDFDESDSNKEFDSDYDEYPGIDVELMMSNGIYDIDEMFHYSMYLDW